MKLSICIPSYNRGHRAYPLVQNLLKLDCPEGDEIEIVLSNNGSDQNTEGYERLKKISDERFHYYEYETNMRFWCNLNQVIQKSTGDWCLLLSDEDNIIPESLEYYMTVIKEHPTLGVIKSASDEYPYDNSGYGHFGLDAVTKFFLQGNYISGTMYNRSIVSNKLVQALAKNYSTNNMAYYYYPHLFIELYALLYGDFFWSEERLILKGEAILDQESSDSCIFSQPAYTTFESRLQQMDGFRKLISDLDEPEEVKLCCFKILVDKHVRLLQLALSDTKALIEDYMIKEIDKTNSPLIIEQKQGMSDYIKILVENML